MKPANKPFSHKWMTNYKLHMTHLKINRFNHMKPS